MTRSKKTPVRQILSVFGSVILAVATVLCFVVVLESAFGNEPPKLFGYRFFYVVTGSMEPTIPAESLIVVKEQKTYEYRDIITYRAGSGAITGEPNTHRIVEVIKDEQGKITGYQTQGDANSIPDDPITPEQVYGKVVRQFPKNKAVTDIIDFAGTKYGFLVIFVIPVVLLTAGALKDVLKAQKEAVAEKVRLQIQQEQQEGNTPEQESESKENQS